MFTWVVQEEFDKTLLNTYGYAADAGRYSAAYKVLQMASLPTKAVVSATHHRFLQQSDRPAHDQTHRAARLSVVVGAYSTVVSVLMFLLADWVPLILGDAFESAVEPLRAISFVLVIRSLTWFPFNGLMGLGLHRSRMIILVFTAGTNLTLNVLLIPDMSWQGAAIATYASESVFLILSWIVLLRARRSEARGTIFGQPDALAIDDHEEDLSSHEVRG